MKLIKLTDDEVTEVESRMQGVLYKATISSFLYTIVGTKMDLEYVVNQHISKARPIY